MSKLISIQNIGILLFDPKFVKALLLIKYFINYIKSIHLNYHGGINEKTRKNMSFAFILFEFVLFYTIKEKLL